MLKMTIDNEEVVSKNDFTIKEEMLSASSTILNNTYPKTWEDDKDYTSRFYYPKDYAKLNIQNFSIEPEEAGTTIQVNGSATLTDVDTTKNSRVLKLLGQTSQTGTPTPSSPIPVNVVSGDNSINVCGKNLFNPQKVVSDSNNAEVYITSDNQYIRFKTGGTRLFYYPIGIRENTQYTFSFTIKNGANSNDIGFQVFYTDGTNETLFSVSYTANQEKTQIKTTASGKTISYIRSIYTSTQEAFIKIEGSQIEVGNQATTYEPYVGSTYPINLGVENLFDKNNVVSVNGKILNDSGTEITDSTGGYTKMYIPVKPNTEYTISGLPSTGTKRIYYFNNSKTFISRTSGFSPTYTTITTPNNCYYLDIQYTTNGGNDFNIYQIEKGTKANSYTPYGTTPIELCKIGTYQDYIYKDNGSWYLHKEIGKLVLNGSESYWAKSGASTENVFVGAYNLHTSGTKTKYGEGSKWLVNRFTYGGLGVADKFNTYNGNAEAGYMFIGLTISTSLANDLAAFKNWLSANNVEVYYVLAEPTTEEITDATLISQLDALESQ